MMGISIIGGTTVCNECGEKFHGVNHVCAPRPASSEGEGENTVLRRLNDRAEFLEKCDHRTSAGVMREAAALISSLSANAKEHGNYILRLEEEAITAEDAISSLSAQVKRYREAVEGKGLVIVPREPTREMLDAARHNWLHKQGPQSRILYGQEAKGIWQAMIAAALTENPSQQDDNDDQR